MARKYDKVSCHSKKSEAKKKQAAMHKKGLTARIVKNSKTGKYCIESAGKRKK